MCLFHPHVFISLHLFFRQRYKKYFTIKVGNAVNHVVVYSNEMILIVNNQKS